MAKAAVIAAASSLLITACGGEEAATNTTYTSTTTATTGTSGGAVTTTTIGPVTTIASTTTTEPAPTSTTLPITTAANGVLVFERTDFLGLGDPGLMRVNPDGGDLRELASETNAFYETSAWSPTGSRVAVSKWGPATRGLGPMPGQGIWLMDADGNNLINLTETLEFTECGPGGRPTDRVSLAAARVTSGQWTRTATTRPTSPAPTTPTKADTFGHQTGPRSPTAAMTTPSDRAATEQRLGSSGHLGDERRRLRPDQADQRRLLGPQRSLAATAIWYLRGQGTGGLPIAREGTAAFPGRVARGQPTTRSRGGSSGCLASGAALPTGRSSSTPLVTVGVHGRTHE